MCGNPYDLLPALASQSRWAWTLAVVYLLTHVWGAGAYLLTVSRTQMLLPPWSAFRQVWGAERPMALSMLGLLAIEYAPIPLWRLVGMSSGCTS
jgi:hypothetical protein